MESRIEPYLLNKMFGYINGNYIVKGMGYSRVKESLRVGEELKADFPDSIDLKITNKCSIGCKFCHENSSLEGKSFDFKRTTSILSELPSKVKIEIALGGGDLLENPQETYDLIKWLNNRGYCVNGTFNIKSLEPNRIQNNIGLKKKIILDLNAIGISVTKALDINEENNLSLIFPSFSRLVFHVILGVIPPSDFKKLLDNDKRVLLLGYKTVGRGETFIPNLSETDLGEYKRIIKEYIRKPRNRYRTGSLGFDNLAVKQLDMKDIVDSKTWKYFFLGEDFTSSMYIDAVSEQYAPTSYSDKSDRVGWNEMGLLEYFKTYHK